LNCPTETFAEFTKNVAFLEMCPIDFPVEGGGTSDGELGGQQSIGQLEDIQPLTQPTEPKTVDEVFDIFARLNSLFDIVEPVTTPLQEAPEVLEEIIERVGDVQERIAEPTEISQSIFDSIRSFFSGLFG